MAKIIPTDFLVHKYKQWHVATVEETFISIFDPHFSPSPYDEKMSDPSASNVYVIIDSYIQFRLRFFA